MIQIFNEDYQNLLSGGHLIVDGQFKEGKIYRAVHKNKNGDIFLSIKCTSWYGPPIKSSFLLVN